MFEAKTKTGIISSAQKREIGQKIKEIKTIGADNYFINKILDKNRNFYGAMAQDCLSKIKYTKIPFSIVVNTDTSNKPGHHWIAIYITKYKIEIFDSLGFNPNNWLIYPTHIIQFVQKYLYGRYLTISKPIQSPYSNLCGLYCIYFILHRQHFSFRLIQNMFTDNYDYNDNLLCATFQ